MRRSRGSSRATNREGFLKDLSSATTAPNFKAPSLRLRIRVLEMLFGTSRPQGLPVTDEEWASFLDSEVTPRFPHGLTVLRGPCQWRGSDGPSPRSSRSRR
jgi:hypothetical protein